MDEQVRPVYTHRTFRGHNAGSGEPFDGRRDGQRPWDGHRPKRRSCSGRYRVLSDNTFEAFDNFSKIVGRYTLKFGGDFRYLQLNPRNIWGGGMGQYSFWGGETGNDFADYLLGAPDSFVQASFQHLDARAHYFGAYAQDSFKVRPNVTFNYGVRWEILQPWYDEYDHLLEFIPGEQSQVYPDAPW